jgi:D-aminopeptidase
MGAVSARPRARELGVAIGTMSTGPQNAITDVPGVAVGHVTLVRGEGPLVPGRGPVRTGVTAILPHQGNVFRRKIPAAVDVINGFGKPTGFAQVAELGNIETPILLTNTLSVGKVWDAVVTYMLRINPDIGIGQVGTVNPVVGECNDGFLNDIQGRHVSEEKVLEAIARASTSRPAEGSVGAGTGMSAFGFKGGIGTASRLLPETIGSFVVGALVLANFGLRENLVIDGVPVGRELRDWSPDTSPEAPEPEPGSETRAVPPGGGEPGRSAAGDSGAAGPGTGEDLGSVVVVVGTDAPLTDRQLGRIARRVGMGLARTGSIAGHGSGDFVIAFANSALQPQSFEAITYRETRFAEEGRNMGALFQATIEVTEEAVVNALFTAETMIGRDGHVRHGLPVDLILRIMQTHGRLRRD